MTLDRKKCAPCEGGAVPLSAEAAGKFAIEVPKWAVSVEPPRVSREFRFRDFKRAMAFVNRVAELAEEEGHHPDIHVHWNRVELVLWTHDIGGLSENDFIVAAKIDRLPP
jgi:4a-hydroxytetrahydrobiopterin dehydratase